LWGRKFGGWVRKSAVRLCVKIQGRFVFSPSAFDSICATNLGNRMTTGTWVHMLLLALVVGGTTNWEVEARKAKERVASK
jgi:hypothetical protein